VIGVFLYMLSITTNQTIKFSN